VGHSVGDLVRIRPACGENPIRCKRSVGGSQVTCVEAMGAYKNGTCVMESYVFICCRSSDFKVGVYPLCDEMRVH
jgi:hypothetical protein